MTLKIKLKGLACALLAVVMVLSTVPVFGQTEERELINEEQGKAGSAFLEGLMMDSDVENVTIELPKKARSSSRAQKSDWAVCIYMCGTNLESRDGAATMDLLEMLLADIPENVKLMVMTGGTKKWNPSKFPERLAELGYLKEDAYIQPKNDVTQLYEINDDEMTLVKEYDGNLNMGDVQTAAQFVGDCLNEAPADRMMLSFWNHGGGPLGGVAYDEYTDDSLSLHELSALLSALRMVRNDKADLLGFDACLMNNLETASMLADGADYMVASEEIIPNGGWSYAWLDALEAEYSDNDGIATLEAEELGRVIVDEYAYTMNENGDWSQIKSETLALVDLSRMGTLKAAFNEMAYELCKVISNDETFAAVSRTAERVQHMQNGFGLLDLYDFAQDVLPYVPKAQAVLDALGTSPGTEPDQYVGEVGGTNPAIVYRGTGLSHNESLGMAFYYPTARDSMNLKKAAANVDFYRSFGVSDFYTAYLMNVVVMSDKLRSFEGTMQVTYDGNASHYVMRIENPDHALSLKSVEYLNLYTDLTSGKANDNYLLGTNRVQADWDNARFTEQFDGQWYAMDSSLCSMDIELAEGDDRWEVFTIPIVVEGETVVSEMIAYHRVPTTERPEFYVYIDSIVTPTATEDGTASAPRTYAPEGDFTFHTILRQYDIEKQQVTGYRLNDAVTISPNAQTGMHLLSDKMESQQLSSGQNALYTGYFKATDLRNQVTLSEPCQYVLLSDFEKDFTIKEIAAQAYTGKPIEPKVQMLFHGQEILEEGVDYKVEYKNNIEIGKATVIVTSLIKGLPGTITAQFEIKAAPDSVLNTGDSSTSTTHTQPDNTALPDSTDAAQNQALVEAVQKCAIKATATINQKHKYIKVNWKNTSGVQLDSYEVFRSTCRNSGYGKTPRYKKAVKNKKSGWCKDAKGLKTGKTYYYKIRGVKTIDGKKIYTKWSNIVSKTARFEKKTVSQNRKLVAGVKKTTIKATAVASKKRKCIKVNWEKAPGFQVDYYEIFRSTRKNSGYGTKPHYKKASQGKRSGWYMNTKGLKTGKTYYYKVRGVRTIAGKRVYTKWSNIVWKKAL